MMGVGGEGKRERPVLHEAAMAQGHSHIVDRQASRTGPFGRRTNPPCPEERQIICNLDDYQLCKSYPFPLLTWCS